MTIEMSHYINGAKISSEGRTLSITNPATGEITSTLNIADSNIVNQAVKAALNAFITWSALTPMQRAKILSRYKIQLEQNNNELAKLITSQHGKTINEALASIQRGIDVLDYACHISNHLKEAYSHEIGSGIDCYTLRQPLGVCAGITPFNFPAMIPLWMFTMAIACGNTFILKPSEKDPACSLRLLELAHDADVPNGVINLVQGDKETVDALIQHADIKAISFVGSSQVAEYVYHQAAQHNKRVQAFGGAKNHALVMPDADMAEAAQAIITSAYDCAGERCMAISVIIAVTDRTADQLIALMKPLIANIKLGAGDQANCQMGPLITQSHWDKVNSYIDMGIKEGAQLIIDGRKNIATSKGFFMGCSLFDHVKSNMTIYKDEIFGPVLCIVRVPDFDTALQLINQHDYGNGAAIFTRDGFTARTFTKQVEAGMVGVNIPVPVPVAYHSFGGWKKSVFSDIGMYGTEGIRFYTKLKTVTQRWIKGDRT
jgi:malonate-semialdehyde dehydrogenase (acetylating)/methylmalonate-semialdehyde dehydrogenase